MGRFLVLGVLGRGGMGVVMEAHDAALDRNVALKLLSSSAARHSEARLLREAQALARLSHPNVVQVYDIGELDGQTFIAMELVRGRTLRAWGRDRHPWRTTVAVYLQAARGLAAAHDKGLVHRDFKPENCIIDDDGRVRVLDFGLARSLAAPDPEPPHETLDGDAQADTLQHESPSRLLGESLTRTGVLLGTVSYMSFEQLQGRAADEISDQYAFCASLYEALHGAGPYAGDDPATLFAAMYRGARRPVPAGVTVPRRLSRALWRGLSKDPAARWPSMHALIAELEALTRARRSRAVILALGVGLLAGAAMSFTRESADPCPDIATALTGTWDADARQRVEQAFAAYGPADDPGLAARVVERLDAHALAWAAMTRDSCQATFVTRRQSEAQLERRTLCLERNRNRLVATIAALADTEDAGALTQAVVLPFRLPGLDACGEVELGEADAAPAEDLDDEHRVALRRAIDEASTLREAGRMDQATTLAKTALVEARALADPGLLAEALEGLGRVQTDSGSMIAAQATLEEAIVAANSAKDDPTAARAWASLVYVATIRGNYDQAQHYVLPAEAAVERTNDDVLRAWLFNNFGVLTAERRQFTRALAYFERALALKQAALGVEHVDVGIAWLNLGTMLSNAGDHRGATRALARARAIFEVTVGMGHPFTTYALSSQCHTELGLGHAGQAIELCEQAVERFESTRLEPYRESNTRFSLAQALWSAGRRAEARVMAGLAQRLVEREDPVKAAEIKAWAETHKEGTESTP